MNPSGDSGAVTAEAVEDAAAAWFCRRDSDNWTSDDETEFVAWLNRSTAHRVAYLRLQAGWKGAARMQALGAGVPRGEIPPPGKWRNDYVLGSKYVGKQEPSALAIQGSQSSEGGAVGASAFRRFCWMFAATFILSVGVTLYLHSTHSSRGGQYSTQIGGLKKVSLADGSHITLNTDTRIRVELSETERRIDLSTGEAFFEVAKDAARPFVVHVDDKRVTAVGTEFSVRRDEDEIQVAVTEGRVKLEQRSAISRLSNLVGAQASPVTTLAAGTVARTAHSEVLVKERSTPDVEQMLSWRAGYLVFEATPLADAVAEFNRYNVRKIVIEDPSLAALRIGGNFRSNNTDAFLWLLKSGFQVEIEEYDGRVHLDTR